MIDNNLTELIENIEDKLQAHILDVIYNNSFKDIRQARVSRTIKVTKLIITPVDKVYPSDITAEEIADDPDNIVVSIVPQEVILPTANSVAVLSKPEKEAAIKEMVVLYRTVQEIKNNIASLIYSDERTGKRIIDDRLKKKIPLLTELRRTLSQDLIAVPGVKAKGSELLSMVKKLITEINGTPSTSELPSSTQSSDTDLIDRIKRHFLTDLWANGKVGSFKDFENTCLYRFCETHESGNSFLQPEQEQRTSQILACGFVGWLIKHWGTETMSIYSGYLKAKLNQYKERHKNDADVFKRDLEQEFYNGHRAEEERWVKHSEAIFEFITDVEADKIREYVRCYFQFVEVQQKPEQGAEIDGSDHNAGTNPTGKTTFTYNHSAVNSVFDFCTTTVHKSRAIAGNGWGPVFTDFTAAQFARCVDTADFSSIFNAKCMGETRGKTKLKFVISQLSRLVDDKDAWYLAAAKNIGLTPQKCSGASVSSDTWKEGLKNTISSHISNKTQ